MISQETMDALKNIGLNLYERKLYTALLARVNATVGELAELADVPRSRAYDVLESLADKGFVIIQHTKPLRCVAVPPAEALEKAKEKLARDFDLTLKRIDQFSKSPYVEELQNLYSQGMSLVDPSELSGALKGTHNLNTHLSTMLKKASSSIDIITSKKGLISLWEHHSRLLKKAAKSGVRIRIAAPLDEKTKLIAEQLKGIAEVRDLRSEEHDLPMGKMVLIDGKQLVLGLTDDEKTHSTQEVAFWTKSTHFSSNFAQNLFNMVWDHLK